MGDTQPHQATHHQWLCPAITNGKSIQSPSYYCHLQLGGKMWPAVWGKLLVTSFQFNKNGNFIELLHLQLKPEEYLLQTALRIIIFILLFPV